MTTTARTDDGSGMPDLPATLERAWPCETVERGGRIVGAWYVRLIEGGTRHADVAIRRPDGTVAGARLEVAGNGDVRSQVASVLADGAYIPASARTFAEVVTAMGEVSLGEAGHLYCLELERHLADECPGAGEDEVVAASYAWLEKVGGRLDAFLATLDPKALREVSGHMAAATDVGRDEDRDDLLACYDGLDGTVTAGAPLRTALEAFPDARQSLVWLWCTERATLSRGGPTAAPDACVARLVSAWGLPPWVARHALDVQAAVVATRTRVEDHGGDEGPVDLLQDLLATLSVIPRDWVPATGDDWAAFVRSALAVQVAAHSLSGVADLPRLLDVRGRWREWEARLQDAMPDGMTLACAVGDAQDVAEAFDRQVLRPAALLAGRGADGAGKRTDGFHSAGSVLLFSGQNLSSVTRRSLRWHARRVAVDAGIATLAPVPGVPEGWGAGLPGHAMGDMSLVVLTSEAELAAEGASGVDGRGVAGLAHCVGGYGRECSSGRIRIASVRRARPDGGWERVSTVQFSVSGDRARIHVAQHRGRGNVAPDVEAAAFVAGYVAMVSRGGTPIDAGGLIPVADVEGGPGYDWRAPGAWEAVWDLWKPLVPRHLRSADALALATLAGRAFALAQGRGWLPDVVLSS